MLSETLHEQITVALKAHEQLRLDTLRMLFSALKYARIDKMRDLTEAEELDVVRKEAKKRAEAVEIYTKANEPARAEKEAAELVILQEYLPAALGTDEIAALVDEAIKTEGNDFGKVMKSVMAATKGSVDGKIVSELVKSKLLS